MVRVKATILDDILFTQSILLLLYAHGIITDLRQMLTTSFIVAALFSYVDPLDHILSMITLHIIEKNKGKPNYLFKRAYESSFVAYSRLKITAGIHLIIISIFILILRPEYWIKASALVIIAIMATKLYFSYFKELINMVSVTAIYQATVGKTIQQIVNYWCEAYRIFMVLGYSEVNVPEMTRKEYTQS